MREDPRRAALCALLRDLGPVAVAVSGGVDSLTLGVVAGRTDGVKVTMVHAVSPAVPRAATERVREIARTQAWDLRIIDAGEFADEAYLANPANRCFFCKTNLYGTMARAVRGTLLSGTNLDDLDDWRPGLEAARDHGVRHPFVEAGFAKADIRTLAADLGLGAVADLPAAPCLSSRLETGLRVAPDLLAMVDRMESALRAEFDVATVRCRIRHAGPELEIDAAFLADASAETVDALRARAEAIAGQRVPVTAYRRGSAFRRTAT